MKLYTVSTGDTAYRYEKSIVVFFKGARKVLSTSVFNGGYHGRRPERQAHRGARTSDAASRSDHQPRRLQVPAWSVR